MVCVRAQQKGPFLEGLITLTVVVFFFIIFFTEIILFFRANRKNSCFLKKTNFLEIFFRNAMLKITCSGKILLENCATCLTPIPVTLGTVVLDTMQ